jgi:hypothetical protein
MAHRAIAMFNLKTARQQLLMFHRPAGCRRDNSVLQVRDEDRQLRLHDSVINCPKFSGRQSGGGNLATQCEWPFLSHFAIDRARGAWLYARAMRTKVICFLCAGLIGLLSVAQTRADQTQSQSRPSRAPSPEAIVADVVLVRPLAFAATVIGSAFFVVALPIAAISRSVDQTAHALVVRPARATFTRPLGEFETLR